MSFAFPPSMFLREPLLDACQALFSKITYDDYFVALLFIAVAVSLQSDGLLWAKHDPYRYKLFEKPQNGLLSKGPSKTRDVGEAMRNVQANVIIFWGSQSGTAEAFAHRLARDFRERFACAALVADMSDYDHQTLLNVPFNSTTFVFVMATYGEGEPSDNAVEFMNWIESSPAHSMNGASYLAFGLGNSNYRFYNKVIDNLSQSLDRLGATSLLPEVGKGNEATRSTNEDFSDWKETLLPIMASRHSLSEREVVYTPRITIVEDQTAKVDAAKLTCPLGVSPLHKGASAIAQLPVVTRRDLIQDKAIERQCIHLELDLSGHPKMKYRTGDHVAIWPVNPEPEVSRLIAVLGLRCNHDATIRCQSISGDPDEEIRLPALSNITALFRHHLEICAPVSREVVLALAQFVTSRKAKGFLKDIAKDRLTFARHLESNYLTFSRVLSAVCAVDETYSWSTLPLSFVLESIPLITPRYYSISSSNSTNPREVSLTVAVKDTTLPLNSQLKIKGLTSTYLASDELEPLPKGSSDIAHQPKLYAQIRPSRFKLPSAAHTPLVMVAAGTGIAPFRGFLQHRERLAATGSNVGNMVLFFGCQHPETDLLYQNELTKLQSGPLRGKFELITAFSRFGHQKVYVQDKIKEHGQAIVPMLLEDDAAFYVCGAVQMAKAVERVVIREVRKVKGLSESEAEAWRLERRRAKRWQEDVWG